MEYLSDLTGFFFLGDGLEAEMGLFVGHGGGSN
jgi:hypothetical protein